MKKTNLQLSAYFLIALGLLAGCAKQNLSERDSRLEQIRNQSERKRLELATVVGKYTGHIFYKDNELDVTLALEVREVPTAVEGEVDPVMIPVLSGYIHLGVEPEQVPFGIESGEYDKKLNKLTLVMNNDSQGKFYMDGKHEPNKLFGTWQAPVFGGGGEGDFEVSLEEAPE